MKPLKVSELTTYINKVLKMDYLLQAVVLEAEISQAKLYPSGHLYLTLKDEEAQIQGIMYKWSVKNLDFEPKHGMKVLVHGQVQCYAQAGRLQLNITEMSVAGEGALHLEFLKRKEKLDKEGLFDMERKKEIPTNPNKIGLVTSLKAAALSDFLRIAARRNSNVEIVISPSLVQGEQAAENLIGALDLLDKIDDLDIIVITRGGGSLEDLWSFNDEELVRKISSLKHPIVSAVGHEIDFTLTDFVSDLRASTPSAAAEVLIPDRMELIQKLDFILDSLNSTLQYYLRDKKRDLETFNSKMNKSVEKDKFLLESLNLNQIKENMVYLIDEKIKNEKQSVELLYRYLSPKYIQLSISHIKKEIKSDIQELFFLTNEHIKTEAVALERMAEKLTKDSEKLHMHMVRNKNNKPLKSIKELEIGEELSIEFYDGLLFADVKEIQMKGE